MSFRVDLLGHSDGEGEKIGIVFTEDGTTDVALDNDENPGAAVIELTPENALELAAQLSDVYALHKRWLNARERDPDVAMPEPRTFGLDVESYRLHMLLESGYDLATAEKLAKDESVDLHKAEQLAKDAGPTLAAEILM